MKVTIIIKRIFLIQTIQINMIFKISNKFNKMYNLCQNNLKLIIRIKNKHKIFRDLIL